MKKMLSMLLILALLISLSVPVLAETTKITMASWQWEEAGFADFTGQWPRSSTRSILNMK